MREQHQHDLLAWQPTARIDRRTDIEDRFNVFHTRNPHVFAEALRLAREWIDRGDRYISTKAILENLRVRVATTGDGGYRVNNDFSAPMARWLVEQEPRLDGVIRMRRTR